MEHFVGEFLEITGVKFEVLFEICFIISLEVLGLVQVLKNFVKCRKADCENLKAGFCKNCMKWKWASISILMCIVCSVMNTTLVHPMATRIFDFFMLSLAITQMCHDTIIKALPKALNCIIDRAIGAKTE